MECIEEYVGEAQNEFKWRGKIYLIFYKIFKRWNERDSYFVFQKTGQVEIGTYDFKDKEEKTIDNVVNLENYKKEYLPQRNYEAHS
ncbi:MAG: hypothetical protein QXG86_02385 [Candidatus Woesearchaeota archaeon]